MTVILNCGGIKGKICIAISEKDAVRYKLKKYNTGTNGVVFVDQDDYLEAKKAYKLWRYPKKFIYPKPKKNWIK